MTPYFERDGVRLYHAPCLEVIATMAPRSVDLCITDPPFTAHVHEGMRSNKGRRGFGKNDRRGRPGGSEKRVDGRTVQSIKPIDFPAITEKQTAEFFGAMACVTRRWVLANVAFEHAAHLYENPPPGLRPVRTGVWVKLGPTPQMTGDRPAQGWEAVAILHADDRKMHWNGGGRPAVWHCQAEMRGEYPTQKPEPLISQFIADFADPGDTILDPFSGGGTTLVCAWKAGHPVIGCDIREEACEVAARRLERVMAQGRIDLPRRVKAKQPHLF